MSTVLSEELGLNIKTHSCDQFPMRKKYNLISFNLLQVLIYFAFFFHFLCVYVNWSGGGGGGGVGGCTLLPLLASQLEGALSVYVYVVFLPLA